MADTVTQFLIIFQISRGEEKEKAKDSLEVIKREATTFQEKGVGMPSTAKRERK